VISPTQAIRIRICLGVVLGSLVLLSGLTPAFADGPPGGSRVRAPANVVTPIAVPTTPAAVPRSLTPTPTPTATPITAPNNSGEILQEPARDASDAHDLASKCWS
jgi:hypothetical protein